jgi:hypothetical protein
LNIKNDFQNRQNIFYTNKHIIQSHFKVQILLILEDLLLLWDKQQQSNPVHVCYLTYRVWQLWGSRQTLSIVSQQVLIGRDLILLIQVIYIETFKTDILFLLYYVTVTDMHISNQSSVPVSFIVLNDSHRLWVIYEKSQSEKYSFVLKPFLAHLAKGNVSFCHPLASVVCRPFNFSHFNLLLGNPSAKWSETW